MSRQPVNQRPAFLVVAALALVALILAVRGHGNPGRPAVEHRRVVGHGQIAFDGAGPERWALRFRRERQIVDRLRQRLRRERLLTLRQPNVVEAINLACATYGNCSSLWRKAQCESRLDPGARNLSSAASGLLQFLPSTWETTPYARFDVFSPYANALAGGWMLANGRDEWACR